MLVLSRKKGESVVLAGEIEVKILETKEGRVKLGIDAPKDVMVVRKEVFEVINENREAGRSALSREELIKLLKKD